MFEGLHQLKKMEPGVITKPKTCSCGCKETVKTDSYNDETYGECEYKIRCKDCHMILGYYSYGNYLSLDEIEGIV